MVAAVTHLLARHNSALYGARLLPRQIRKSLLRIAGFIYAVQESRWFSPVFGRFTLCGSVFVSVPRQLDAVHGPFFGQLQAARRSSGGLGLGRCPDAVPVETFLNLYKSAFIMARSHRRPEVDDTVEPQDQELVRLQLCEQHAPRG